MYSKFEVSKEQLLAQYEKATKTFKIVIPTIVIVLELLGAILFVAFADKLVHWAIIFLCLSPMLIGVFLAVVYYFVYQHVKKKTDDIRREINRAKN